MSSAREQTAANIAREAAGWLNDEIVKHPFGEVGIKFTTHAGRISRVEKIIIEKENTSGG